MVEKFVPERFGGVYLIADAQEEVIYAGESPRLRDALRKHAAGESAQAACLRSHEVDRFMFTVIRATRPGREGELQELLEFYNPPCNG
ncbi:MAG: GIY-YIG nuclease family protein [bacterium]|nr:GIY-YIG nuclease family protein [bacterium]